jgi:hyaluronan synthase
MELQTMQNGVSSSLTHDAPGVPASASPAPARAPLSGVSCHCEACRIRIRGVTTPLPVVCPFCQARMERSAFTLDPFTPDPSWEPGQAQEPRIRYFEHATIVKWMLIVFSILLLSIAVFLKFHNLDYFWYQPAVNTYSLTVGIFILSRFILSAFYVAPPEVGFEPTVTVVVACRNEEGSIERTIARAYSEGYPHSKLGVVAVNDGSTDHTLRDMYRAQARHPSLVIVDFEENKGKRHGMAVGALLAHGEILVYVDSDSFLMPGAIHKIVQGLADPTVAAVAGHTDVENDHVNVLTKMQDVRYFTSYRVMKAAESIFGAVSCCPGCFSAYRKSCVLNVLDRWLRQKFLGQYATFGDDRALTNYLLRDYRVLYDDEALATTLVPEGWSQYIRQQCRWKRSWIREIFFAGWFFWRLHPVAAISWYAMVILPLLAPLVMFYALIIGPLVYGQPAGFYVGGVAVVSLLWSLYYLEKTGRRHWWAGFLFTLSYVVFFSWQGYYALITMRRTTWGTR